MKRFAFTLVLGTSAAQADPLVLTANALATTTSPAGLVSVSANATPADHVSVEAVVWTGGGGNVQGDSPADVLVMVMRARTESGLASVQLGRYVASLGALRPIQIDGAGGRLRLPHRLALEAYAGVPVLRDLAMSRAWDWVVGTRASRQLGDDGSIGIAYLQQREEGRLSAEEVGIDGGAAIGAHEDRGFAPPPPELCTKCHAGVMTPLHPGLHAPACQDCHGFGPDEAITPRHCMRCHDRPQAPVHAVGAHRDQPCGTCHAAHRTPSLQPKPCLECHADQQTKHAGTRGCLDCHHMHEADRAADTRCATCHATEPAAITLGHPKCTGCHVPHKFAAAEVAPCTTCHRDQPVRAKTRPGLRVVDHRLRLAP